MATPMPLPLYRCNPPHLSLPRRTLRTTAAIAGIPAKPVRLEQPPVGLVKKGVEPMVVGGLEVLYDDGYGTESVKDYLEAAREIIKPDGGPPRWFCPVECGRPVAGSPVLLFLPGIDGVGMGLILHHKSLGKLGRPDSGPGRVILSVTAP